jgi:hypothetical protein
MNNSNQAISKLDSEIRKNRMADATITVLNADGSPLANREVTVEQVRHKFLFGTAAFDLVPFTNGEYRDAKLEQAQQPAEKLLVLFNAATLPFYWARFEPQRGKPMTKKVQNAARWCLDHHLLTKGHPLCWHTLTADWLLEMSNEEILQEQIAHQRRVRLPRADCITPLTSRYYAIFDNMITASHASARNWAASKPSRPCSMRRGKQIPMQHCSSMISMFHPPMIFWWKAVLRQASNSM